MKALIPSHKENKRYLLVQGKDLKKNVSYAIKEYLGVLGLAKSTPRWISIDGEIGVLSINRKSLDEVRASFALSKSRIEILKVSGTLKKLKS
jgi:RNase P/RNase MRP subunit POP5